MHAAVDAGVQDVLKRLREARVVAHWLCQSWDEAVHGEVEVVGPEEVGKRLAGRTAEAAVRGWVFGVIWRDYYSYPVGIRNRFRIPIGVALARIAVTGRQKL